MLYGSGKKLVCCVSIGQILCGTGFVVSQAKGNHYCWSVVVCAWLRCTCFVLLCASSWDSWFLCIRECGCVRE